MIIDLENLNGLPQKFIQRLNQFDDIFTRFRFLEDYEDFAGISLVIRDINTYCLENNIIGYHYTKVIDSDILKNGIIIRTGKEIRNDFVNRHFHLFTIEEQNQIMSCWKKRFGEKDTEHRDSRIFFNFTKKALPIGGADLLLNYYGGEQVYFPIYDLPSIGDKLKGIGTSMILKCVLNPNDLNTFFEYPWGKIIVSSYNRLKNPNAHVWDQDGYQKIGVNPENIEIIKYESTFANNHPQFINSFSY